MENEIDNIIIEHLKALRNEIRSFKAETEENFMIIKNRLSSVEDQLVGIHADIAALNRRADRIDERLTRIERKNDLVEA